MQMILNELSLNENEMNEDKAIQVFEQFISTYSEAVKSEYGIDRSILTGTDLNLLSLSNGYTISKWRNNTSDRDMRRRFLDMCDRQEVIEFCQDESEVTCDKGRGAGLLAAYENSDLCISFVFDSYWELYEIPCNYYSLLEDCTYPIKVYNISQKGQLSQNLACFQQMRKKEILEVKTPHQLLEKLDSLFPSLIFHEVAINQLESEVQICHIGTLCNKLMLLEQYFAKWDGSEFDDKAFPIRSISPQSKETLKRFKSEHTFSFKDENIVVSYHMRYTGNLPGRIYFHPAGKLKKAYICSLTTKLPTVSEPKLHI